MKKKKGERYESHTPLSKLVRTCQNTITTLTKTGTLLLKLNLRMSVYLLLSGSSSTLIALL